jgi:hypothetical protein
MKQRVEANPLTNMSSPTIKKFFWQNIIYRYGVPRQITIDNAKYFDSTMLKDFCQQVRTNATFTFVYHPQSNGVVERANTLIFEAINKVLKGKKKSKWVEVMPRAVWSHNTTVSQGDKLCTIPIDVWG